MLVTFVRDKIIGDNFKILDFVTNIQKCHQHTDSVTILSVFEIVTVTSNINYYVIVYQYVMEINILDWVLI